MKPILDPAYEWTICSDGTTDPNSIDLRFGETVKYGDEVLLLKNVHKGINWLTKTAKTTVLTKVYNEIAAENWYFNNFIMASTINRPFFGRCHDETIVIV